MPDFSMDSDTIFDALCACAYIFLVFFVVILHCLGTGGVLELVSLDSVGSVCRLSGFSGCSSPTFLYPCNHAASPSSNRVSFNASDAVSI